MLPTRSDGYGASMVAALFGDPDPEPDPDPLAVTIANIMRIREDTRDGARRRTPPPVAPPRAVLRLVALYGKRV